MKKLLLEVEEFRLSFIFTSVEPIPEGVLLSWLEERGFAEIRDVPKRIGTETFGIERLNIARKGACQVIYDPRVGNLGIAGRRYEEVLEEFDRVATMLKEMGFDFLKEMKCFELVLEGRVFAKGKPKPLEKITDFLETEKFSALNRIIGAEVIPFDIRFCPKSEMGTIEDLRRIPKWFDIHIHPYVPNPNYYGVRLVFRDTDISNVKKFAETANDKIVEIINVILGSRKK